MTINKIDHIVLTVKDIAQTSKFYAEVLGMKVEIFDGRTSLKFGDQKLNLHQKGHEFEPKANLPTPGAIDICFIISEPIEQIKQELQDKGIITQGILERTGAKGKIRSVYFRDPDGNLLEVSNYILN